MAARTRGVAEILLSGFCFGFLGVLGKSFYSAGGTPGELLSLRFLIAAACLWGYWLIRDPRSIVIPGRTVGAAAVLGILGYAVFSSFFFHALTGLSASLTFLLLYLYPVMVAIGGWALFGESIARSRLPAIPIAILGLGALVWGDLQVGQPVALFFGVGSAVFYALYILASSRWLAGVHPLVAATWVQTFAGLSLGALYLRDLEHVSALVARTWPTLIALALICSIAAMSLFLSGLQKLKSWEASILSLAEPVTGIALAIFFLGDRLTLLQVFGGIAVFGALIFVSVPVRR